MQDDWNFLDAHGPTGVGQYDAGWARGIEAEWFMVGTHVDKVQTNAGGGGGASTMITNNTDATFAVRFINASSALGFPSVANLPAAGTLVLQLAPGRRHGGEDSQGAGGVLALYAQAEGSGSQGTLLASCSLTGKARVSCPLVGSSGSGGGGISDGGSGGSSTDLMFVFEPPSMARARGAAGAASVLLDSWSVVASSDSA
eukprot:SAG22_NODE_461_length_10216_cov_25.124543_8_plen_200_part_00